MYQTIKQAIEAVENDQALLIDVRSLAEHHQQSAEKAIHLDVEDIISGSDPDVSKETVILLYCRSGGRAGTACNMLVSRGYKHVYNVGGLDQWLTAGGKPRQ